MRLYAPHMQRLLWTEEFELVRDLQQFDMVNETSATLQRSRRDGKLFSLRVEGLAEKRPSVLRGDRVDLVLPHEPARVYVGEAREIEMENVHLALDRRFAQRYATGGKVEVRFRLPRGALRCFHAGLEAVRDLPNARSLLFPEPLDLAPKFRTAGSRRNEPGISFTSPCVATWGHARCRGGTP